MKKFQITCILTCLLFHLSFAQTTKKAAPGTDVYFGIGAGLDYGGFGAKVEFLPAKQMGFFFAGGYNLDRLTYNTGISAKLTPQLIHSPTLIAMYGYNAVINVNSDPSTYYGFTVGLGYDYQVGKNSNKFSAALLFPLRSQAFKDKINSFGPNNQPKVNKVLISLGYNLAGSTKKKKTNL